MNLHVGVVSYDYAPPIGGLGRVAAALVSVVRKISPEIRFTTISSSKNADCRVSSFAVSRWGKRGGCPAFSFALFLRLAGIVRDKKIDVLHVHAGSGGVWLLRKPPCPLVVTAHHTYIDEAMYVFRSPLKRVRKWLMSLLERRTYILADAVICVSADTAASLMNTYRIAPGKISVIENGIASSIVPSTFRSGNTVLYVGRMEIRKGIDTLIRAFQILHRERPDARLRLVGSNLMGEMLGALIDKAGIRDVTDTPGYLAESGMQRELSSAAVLVVPSLLEGFGLIAAEGMLAGTCVVTSDCKGLRSIVRSGDTGFIFRSGDPVDCARALREALADSERRASIALRAQSEAKVRFSPEKRAMDYVRTFEAVTSHGKPLSH